MADRFFIAPYDSDSGLQNNVKPWLIADSAFSELTNAYVFRGRVRKRFGSQWLGDDPLGTRLRVQVNTLTGGAANGTVPDSSFAIGQMFSIGTELFTVWQANGAMLDTGISTTHTYNTANGVYSFTGVTQPDGTPVYFYPALPVMGLLIYETDVQNNELTIAFDTLFAYQYINGWTRISAEAAGNAGAATWSGSDSQFFWGTTWTGADVSNKIFYVTNFNQNEKMRTYDGTAWSYFAPQIDNTPNYLFSAAILVPFKNRLLAFDTWEGPNIGAAVNYPARARWCAFGDPLASNAWNIDTPSSAPASFLDASTTEAIITIEFIKDRLIVYFERSTYEFVFNNNQAYPYAWQQINTELGAESTFSVIPFDKIVLGVGSVGIHACNGQNVERIDDKIPQEVFEVHNADQGIERIYGVRDYSVEMVYWTFPSADTNAMFPYPNRILVYNYKNGTWAFNEDSITAFGYFWPQTGILWSSTSVKWSDPIRWNGTEAQSGNQTVIAGNQEGYTFLIQPDYTQNAAVLQITNITALNNEFTITTINHNLRVGEYVLLSGIVDPTGNLTLLNNRIFQITVAMNPNSFVISSEFPPAITGTYAGGGVVARVSNIFIQTKEYNFYQEQGRNAYVSKVDFMVDKTSNGIINIDFYASTSTDSLLQEGIASGAVLGTGALETSPYPTVPFEQNATRLWHTLYMPLEGEVIQLYMTMSDAQMRTIITDPVDGSFTGPALQDFQLHAMLFTAMPTTDRLQ